MGWRSAAMKRELKRKQISMISLVTMGEFMRLMMGCFRDRHRE